MKKTRMTRSEEERERFQFMIPAGEADAKTLAHAGILLTADLANGGQAWPDHRIAEAAVATGERDGQRRAEQGSDADLRRKEQDRPSRELVLDGRAEARLTAPAGSARRSGRCGSPG